MTINARSDRLHFGRRSGFMNSWFVTIG